MLTCFEIDKLYAKLDALRRQVQNGKKGGKSGRNRPLTKRVFLNRKTDADKTPWPMIYPCMLDTDWYKTYLDGMEDEGVFTYKDDPEGWADQSDKDINIGADE